MCIRDRKRISSSTLRYLRNEIPARVVIERLLQLPSKEVEGVYKYQSPYCKELTSSINPRENLGRCHRCNMNFNPIDLVMASTNQSFPESVKMLLEKQSLLSSAPQPQPTESRGDSLEPLEIPQQLSCLLNNPSSYD